ncbi:MAG: aminoacyl-tRNA hydrolase [Clostridia bacterium]|nr:aminoacyl-tRNA hydrolase [Clostridia bacterium]
MADIFDLFKKIAKKEEDSPKEPITWLIVGLGNTGDKYFNTRHNAGFLCIDYISQKCNARIDRAKFHSLCGEATIGTHRVLLIKPQTLMNASGKAVGEAAAFYKIPPERILVLSDDITQAPGKLRLRRKGSAGGHNGLKDIIAHLSSDAFPRIRLGVGEKPHPDYDLAAWVLSDFTKEEQKLLFDSFGSVWEGLGRLLDGKFDDAMQICNSHRPTTEKE